MAPRRQPGRLLAIAVALVLAVGIWFLDGRDAGTSTAPEPDSSPSYSGSYQPAGPSGFDRVGLAQLPPEAADTVDLIDAGGPYPYDEDDGVFGNREGLLPDAESGFYREYTVRTPGSSDRGARRIIAADDDVLYWTADHYASFQVIER